MARSILQKTDIRYGCKYRPSPTYSTYTDHNQDLTLETEDEMKQDKKPDKQVLDRLSTPAQSKSPGVWNKAGEQQTLNGAPITKSSSKAIVVQIPAPPPSYRREDYEPLHSPKRRKLSHDDGSQRQSVSERQQSDEALRIFRRFLTNIFEAADSAGSGDNMTVSGFRVGDFLELADLENVEEPTLNINTLERLKDELKYLLTHGRISDVPVEDLQRLQKLCESPVERLQILGVRAASDSDEEMSSWRGNLFAANRGLSSAIVSVYTMVGNPQQESLISSELLRWSSVALVNVLENCLIPVVEARADVKDTDVFKQATSCADILKLLLTSSRRLLDLLASACVDVKGGNECLNAIEFLAAKLIFVQNATSEKNSVLGLQTYENFRKNAMVVLSRLYARFPSERTAILDEILSSLDKLPSTSRSARTFRAGEGRSIQLISALFMQLVQTTAMSTPKSKSKHRSHRKNAAAKASEGEEDMQDSEESEIEQNGSPPPDSNPVTLLDYKVERLFRPASRSAQEIIVFLVAKASKTTKTGDSPYRNILDLLIEDLINVLDSYEWPSAELLLSILASRMLDSAKNEKTASAKNMALESLGMMGSAISKLRTKLSNTIENLRHKGLPSTEELVRLFEIYIQSGGVMPQELVSMHGPFVLVAKYLSSLSKKTLQQQSVQGYYSAHMAHLISQFIHSSRAPLESSEVITHTLEMLDQATVQDSSQDPAPRDVIEAAYLFGILHLSFSRRLPDMVKTLSSSLSSDQAQVRSRSLKSVSTVLEIDSSLLDRDQSIADDVFKCASDDSAMVRDSALSLIARFIIPRGGNLERRGIERLLQCAADEKIGVQKRSIGHLKDIYTSEQRPRVKNMIVKTLFRRLKDHEESIVTLAEQSLEEMLLRPATALLSKDENNAVTVVAMEDLATVLMSFVEDESQLHIALLKKLLVALLKREHKTSGANLQLCGRLVHVLFEKIMDKSKVRTPLLVLTALCEADPGLVAPVQLAKLQIYLTDIKSEIDLFMFRSAVGIFQRVLPNLSETHKTLLKETQDRLMQSIQRLARRLELDAVMACLNSINGTLQNTERLLKLSSSMMKSLLQPNLEAAKAVKLLRIAGSMGKHVDLEKSWTTFKEMVPPGKANSVSGYIVQCILPWTSVKQSQEIRLVALESLGSVCITNSSHFNKPNVRNTFFDLLKVSEENSAPAQQQLKAVVLNIFDELYAARALSKEQADKAQEGDEPALKAMGGDAKSRDQDSAISAVTMTVTDLVLEISMSESSENALPAAKTLASISHQGLIHPKQCLGAFVAFGTSKNTEMAIIGHEAQKLLHEQHESHCEREYMSAIAQAYKYQNEIEGHPYGANTNGQTGFKAKLSPCFDIVTVSNSKYVKKFLSGVVSRTAIDSSTVEQGSPSRDHVNFTRFLVQNIAFFEYKKLDELLHVVLQLELAYSKSGGEVAAQIETSERTNPKMIVHKAIPGNPEMGLESTSVEEETFAPAFIADMNRLSTSAATLMLLIETRAHLIRQYGLGRDVRAALANSKQAKETNRIPTKVHGITGDKFWTKSNAVLSTLEHESGVLQLCQDFAAAMSVEDDFEVADDSVADLSALPVEPDMIAAQRMSTPGGRKRKLSATPGTTPTKRQRGRLRKSQARRSSSISTTEDPDADFED